MLLHEIVESLYGWQVCIIPCEIASLHHVQRSDNQQWQPGGFENTPGDTAYRPVLHAAQPVSGHSNYIAASGHSWLSCPFSTLCQPDERSSHISIKRN